MQLPGGEAQLAEIVRLLDSNHLRVESLQLHQPSLDDVFLAKTGPQARGSRRGRDPRAARCSEQVAAVARRSAMDTYRQRALLIFPMLFPLILFAINGSALSRATEIPGFPTHSYRAFLLAMPFIQGAMFVSISAGTSLARDIETGFLNRLALTPLRSEAMLLGTARRRVRARRACRRSSTCSSASRRASDIRERRRRRVRAARCCRW